MEMKEKENEKDARRVLLSVTGLAKNQEAEDEAVHLLTTGTLSGRPDAWRLDYVETQPDSQESAVTLTLGGGVSVRLLPDGQDAPIEGLKLPLDRSFSCVYLPSMLAAY